MNNRVLSCLIAGALAAALALASPALAAGRGGSMGGGGMGGGSMGGGRGAVMGGGMGGGMASGPHFSAMSGGPHVSAMSGGPQFSGGRFAGAPFAHRGFSPRFSRFAFHDRGRFHHHFRRFAFIGAPFAYAAYDSCWRRVWTPYGLRWVDVCGDYGYYGYY